MKKNKVIKVDKVNKSNTNNFNFVSDVNINKTENTLNKSKYSNCNIKTTEEGCSKILPKFKKDFNSKSYDKKSKIEGLPVEKLNSKKMKKVDNEGINFNYINLNSSELDYLLKSEKRQDLFDSEISRLLRNSTINEIKVDKSLISNNNNEDKYAKIFFNDLVDGLMRKNKSETNFEMADKKVINDKYSEEYINKEFDKIYPSNLLLLFNVHSSNSLIKEFKNPKSEQAIMKNLDEFASNIDNRKIIEVKENVYFLKGLIDYTLPILKKKFYKESMDKYNENINKSNFNVNNIHVVNSLEEFKNQIKKDYKERKKDNKELKKLLCKKIGKDVNFPLKKKKVKNSLNQEIGISSQSQRLESKDFINENNIQSSSITLEDKEKNECLDNMNNNFKSKSISLGSLSNHKRDRTSNSTKFDSVQNKNKINLKNKSKKKLKNKVLLLKENLNDNSNKDYDGPYFNKENNSSYMNHINSRLSCVYDKKQWNFGSNVKSRLNIIKEKMSNSEKMMSKEKIINKSLIYSSEAVKNDYFYKNDSVKLKSMDHNRQTIEENIKLKYDSINKEQITYIGNNYKFDDVKHDPLKFNQKNSKNTISKSYSKKKIKSVSKSKITSNTDDISNLFLTLNSKNKKSNAENSNDIINVNFGILKDKINENKMNLHENKYKNNENVEYMTNNNNKFLRHLKPLSISSTIVKL